MKDAVFNWTKLILERWTVILPMILFLGSSAGLSFSMMDNADKDLEIEATQKQITEIANFYAKPKPKQECGGCAILMKKHKAELH